MKQLSPQHTVKLRDDEIAQCEEVFKEYEMNSSEGLSLWDLRKALRKIGIRPIEEHIFDVVEHMDENNGSIDVDSFKLIVSLHKRKNVPSHDFETRKLV
jgi:Ca2+-binding EF-hand superfamily protein